MKDKIAEILLRELHYVYCHNCESSDLEEDDDNYGCDDCSRKRQGWSLRKSTADGLAESIVKELE